MTTTNQTPKLAFIGGGNMAEAMIKGLLLGGYPATQILVSTATATTRERLQADYGIVAASSNQQAIDIAEVIFISVKPHQVDTICTDINNATATNVKLIVSIAAGIHGSYLEQLLNAPYHIITSMPNLPIAVGEGVTSLYNHNGDSEDQALIEAILNSAGSCEWLASESDMPAAIAAAGSSPAYFFMIFEAMQTQLETMGISPEQAQRFVQQSALGAAKTAIESDDDFATLRRKVTSPNGTTHAAITTFESGGLRELIGKGMANAANRAEEIAAERAKG